MEWQGVDLSNSKQADWVSTHYTTLKHIFYFFLLIAGISLCLVFYHLQKKQEIELLANQLNQLQTETTVLENKMIYLQNAHKTELAFAKSPEIEKLLNLIYQLPLKNGGIHSIQIYIEQSLYLRLSGKLNSNAEFQILEEYLRHQHIAELKTDKINVNHKNETHFIFTLKYQGE